MTKTDKRWLDIIVHIMEDIGGLAKYEDLYAKIEATYPSRLTSAWKATVRRTIEDHSSDSNNFRGKDVFYSVGGLGSGTWGLRNFNPDISPTPIAPDLVNENLNPPDRILSQVYRIARDTKVSLWVKNLYDFRCQICSHCIELPMHKKYAEAHHIKPLGAPHNGLDIKSNILCLCPNHHVELDYGVIKLRRDHLTINDLHGLDNEFINYHNEQIYKS